ncbi:MAG TPA: hypothetical protein VGL49_05300 [Acidimicrobiales bacterium]|jgi:hypothetical protein
MPLLMTPHAAAFSAASAAARAAAQAGVTVTALSDAADAHQVARPFGDIWASDRSGLPISAHAVRALATPAITWAAVTGDGCYVLAKPRDQEQTG